MRRDMAIAGRHMCSFMHERAAHNGTRMTETSQSQLLKKLPLIIIVIVAVIGTYLLRDQLTFDALSENREALLAFRDANYLMTCLLFVAAYVAIVAFSLPGATIATLTGGFLFGVFPGALINVTGATLGATGIFLAARWGFGEALSHRLDNAQGIVKKVKAGINDNQWSMLFLMRLLPVVPFFLANLIPSFLGVPLYRFVISTFFGIIPGSVIYTSVGAGLGEIFATGRMPNLGIIFEPAILFPIIGLSALVALPVVIRAIRGRKGL